MKLIHKDKIKETVCPSGGYCRGTSCSAFNKWYDWWEYKYVNFWWKVKWWHYFRPFKYNKLCDEAFVKWEPEEIEGWDYVGKGTECWRDESYYAKYERLNPDGRWSCGLNVENS